MASISFEELVQIIMDDGDFTRALQEDPRAALESRGYEVSDEMAAALNAFNWESAKGVASAFGDVFRARFT